MKPRVAHLAAVLLLVAGGCADDPDTGAEDPASTPTTQSEATESATTAPSSASPTEPTGSTEPARKGVTITTGDSPYGPMLFDAKDQAIYIWELEPTAEPTCYDDCARAWPPVLTDGAPVAAGDVRRGLLGTTERRDGSLQVTYNDHPLYFYADEAPGEVKCHNISTHGGLWWVIQPDGDRAA